MPCIPPEVKARKVEEPLFSWSKAVGEIEISQKDYPGWRIENSITYIKVQKAQLNQSSKFFCTAKSRVKQLEAGVYEHNLAVFQLPEYSMKWGVYMLTKSCDKESRFKKYVQENMKYLCGGNIKDCDWSLKYITCIASGADTSKDKWQIMKTWTTGKQSDLIVEFEMRLKVAKNFRVPECDLTCMTKNVKLHLETEAKAKLESFKATNRDAYRDSLDLTFLEKKMSQEIALICPQGYEQYKTEVCMPCFPGTYKAGTSDEKCQPCSYFSYQPLFATGACTSCPPIQLTEVKGAESQAACKLYVKSVMFWIVAVLCLLVLAGPIALCVVCCKRFGNSGVGSSAFFKSCDRCCGFGSKFKPPDAKYQPVPLIAKPKKKDELPPVFMLPPKHRPKKPKRVAIPEATISGKKKKGEAGKKGGKEKKTKTSAKKEKAEKKGAKKGKEKKKPAKKQSPKKKPTKKEPKKEKTKKKEVDKKKGKLKAKQKAKQNVKKKQKHKQKEMEKKKKAENEMNMAYGAAAAYAAYAPPPPPPVYYAPPPQMPYYQPPPQQMGGMSDPTTAMMMMMMMNDDEDDDDDDE